MEFDWLPITRAQQNCSVLWCEKTRKAAIIDPGGDIDQLLGFIDVLEVEPELILVTHGHFDHCGGAAQLARATGARIEGPHKNDAHLVQGSTDYARKFGFKAQAFTPDRWLEDGDQVRFGEQVIDVLHCPGHTQGHVAYFSPSRSQAFVGDILFRHTIGAWEHADGNLPQLLDSIRTKLFALGDDVRFLPGHGETSSFGHEREHNPFVGDAAYAKWLDRRAAPKV